MVGSSWDKRWMALAELVASWSNDPHTKNGAVIVDDRQVLLSLGWNGCPRKVVDDIKERYTAPAKYKWVEHAERNAIYNAAATGHKCFGSRMYITWFPCSDCARAIIQAGIVEIVGKEPNWDNLRWKEDFRVAKEMLLEVGVEVNFLGRREDEPLSENT